MYIPHSSRYSWLNHSTEHLLKEDIQWSQGLLQHLLQKWEKWGCEDHMWNHVLTSVISLKLPIAQKSGTWTTVATENLGKCTLAECPGRILLCLLSILLIPATVSTFPLGTFSLIKHKHLSLTHCLRLFSSPFVLFLRNITPIYVSKWQAYIDNIFLKICQFYTLGNFELTQKNGE